VTERATFQKVKSWLEEVEVNCDKMPVIILVGNKTDLADQRQVTVQKILNRILLTICVLIFIKILVTVCIVSTQEGRELAKRSKLMFMEASAKTKENVNDVFYELSEKILENPDLFESANRPKQGVNLNQQSDGWMSWLGGTISSWTGGCNLL